MKIYDLSQPIYDDAPNCPDHPPVRSTLELSHQNNDGWQLEYLSLSNHTGSHVDAPLHRIADGASLDELPLEAFVGCAVIADVRGLAPMTPIGYAMLREALAGKDVSGNIVVIWTGWGDKRAKNDEWLRQSPFVAHDGAQFLVESGAKGVGIDHYSVGDVETHRILLAAEVWIVEDLRLTEDSAAAAESSLFYCLPINLQRHSGAWCRPVFVTTDE